MKYKKLIVLLLTVILSIGNITLYSTASVRADSQLETDEIPEVADIDSSTLTVYPNPINGTHHHIQDVITGTGSYFSGKNSFLYCTDAYGNTMMCYCTEPNRPAPTTSTSYTDYTVVDIHSEEGIQQAKTLPILTYGFGANEASCNSFMNNYPESPHQGGTFGYYAVDGIVSRGLLVNGVLFRMSSAEAYGLTAALVHKKNGADVGTITGSVSDNGFTSGSEVAAAATYLEAISDWTYQKGVEGGSLWHAADALNHLKRGNHTFTAQINHPSLGWIPLPDTSTVNDWSPYAVDDKINVKITYESSYMESRLLASSQTGSEGYVNYSHESITTVDFDPTKNGYYDYFKVISNPENQVNVSVTYGKLRNNYFVSEDINCSTHSGISFCQDAIISFDLNQLNAGKYLSLSISTGTGACRTDAYGDGNNDGVFSLGIRYFQTQNYQNVAVSSPNGTIPYTSTYLYMSHEQGTIILQKNSSNSSITASNDNYSLEGATYKLYKSEDDAKNSHNPCGSFTTDKTGKSTLSNVNLGTYYIKESKPPKGYAIDSSIYTVSLTSPETDYLLDVNEHPQIDTVDILLTKTDENNIPLANAEFIIKYYTSISDDPAKEGLSHERSWTVKTDKNGIAKLDDEHLVSGDDFYYSSQGEAGFPIGTVTIEETVPPNGYYRDDDFVKCEYIPSEEIYIQKIYGSGNAETINCFSSPTIINDTAIYKAYLKLIKKDDTTNKSILNNSATFKIWSYDYEEYISFTTDESSDNSNNITYISEFQTDSNGVLMTPDYLEEGKYRIEEIISPENYYVKDTYVIYDFEISRDSVTENYVTPEGKETAIGVYTIELYNTPVTGQIIIEKTGEYQHWDDDNLTFELKTTPLKNIQFDIYTYEDIYSLDGHNELIHSANTLVETIYTNEYGYAESSQSLPLGTYVIKEQSPNIYIPYEDTIIELSDGEISETLTGNISKKVAVYKLDILNKLIVPEIETYAYNKETKTQYCMTQENTELIDVISYKNLVPGEEYTLTGTLMHKTENEPLTINDSSVISKTTFIPTDTSGQVEVSFLFDSSDIGSIDIVVFEELYLDDNLVACHKDYESEEQTIHFATPPVDAGPPEEPVIPEEPTTQEESAIPEEPTTQEEPVIPEEPTTQEEPVIPEEPTTQEEPVIPEEPTTQEEPVIPEEPAQPEPPSTPKEPPVPPTPDSPKTGDSSSVTYIVILFILSAIFILVLIFKRFKFISNKNSQ